MRVGVVLLHFFVRHQTRKVLKRPIVGFFGVHREKTTGNLALGKVRPHAVATETTSATGQIGTGTLRFVRFDFTVH